MSQAISKESDIIARERENEQSLSRTDDKPQQLTEAQTKRMKLYKDMYIDVLSGISISGVAERHGVSRPTVYACLEFFKNTDLVTDAQINVTIALERVRKRLMKYKAEEEQFELLGMPGISGKSIWWLRREIRNCEELEMNLLGLLKNGNEEKEKGNKIIILNNIRGTDVETKIVEGERLDIHGNS